MSDTKDLVKRNKILERRWKIALILLILFVVTRPIALYIVKNFIYKPSDQNEYPLIDPARQFIDQEDYVLNIQPLRDYLNTLEEKYPENLSIYYEQLNSGANISVNKDLKLYVASMIKLPIAMVAVRQVEKGVWNWDTKFTISGPDVDQDSGSLYKNTINFDPENDTMTVEQLLTALLVDSDNTAQNIFVRNIPQENFDEFEEEIGLKEVFDSTGHASAKEYSRILRSLYTSSFLERKNSQKILYLLKKKNYESQFIIRWITFS
jgi:hypothetical protein